MLSLEKRRYLFDVVFLYKVLNGYLNMELTPLLNFYSKADPYKFRHVDDYSLKRNYARTTKFKKSYFNIRERKVESGMLYINDHL